MSIKRNENESFEDFKQRRSEENYKLKLINSATRNSKQNVPPVRSMRLGKGKIANSYAEGLRRHFALKRKEKA